MTPFTNTFFICLIGIISIFFIYFLMYYYSQPVLVYVERKRRMWRKMADGEKTLDTKELPKILKPSEYRFLNQVQQYIEDHLDKKIKAGELAKKFGVCRTTFHKKIKHCSGRSTMQYIRHIKLQKAKEFLGTTNMNVTETAYALGFNPVYFSKIFKREFGISPSRYKKSC